MLGDACDGGDCGGGGSGGGRRGRPLLAVAVALAAATRCGAGRRTAGAALLKALVARADRWDAGKPLIESDDEEGGGSDPRVDGDGDADVHGGGRVGVVAVGAVMVTAAAGCLSPASSPAAAAPLTWSPRCGRPARQPLLLPPLASTGPPSPGPAVPPLPRRRQPPPPRRPLRPNRSRPRRRRPPRAAPLGRGGRVRIHDAPPPWGRRGGSQARVWGCVDGVWGKRAFVALPRGGGVAHLSY